MLELEKLKKHAEDKIFFFEEKTFSSVKIAILLSSEVSKKSSGSRPFSYVIFELLYITPCETS